MAFVTSAAMRVSGIYRFRNTVNGKAYVGSSRNIQGRVLQHLSMLRKSEHHNAHFQAAFNKYGEPAFEIEIIETCPAAVILQREQHHIDAIRPEYNILPIAGNSTGYRHSPEAKAKMTLANMGNKRFQGKRHGEATLEKLRAAAANRPPHTPERKARQSAAMMGRRFLIGRTLSPEHRSRVAAGLTAAWAGADGSKPRSREAAAERARARWADPAWKAEQLARIQAGKAASKARRGLE